MSLESLIAKTRNATNAATNAAVLQTNQAMESGLGDLTTEQAEINPYYNSLINETNKNFETTLGNTRSSAASRGAFWGSGGLSNQELSLGKEQASKLSEYGAERTRKLADISRRRSLLKKQTAEQVKSIRAKGGADLELTIADMRYKEYVRQQEARERAADRAASRASSAANVKQWQAEMGINQQLGQDIAAAGREMITKGLSREQVFSKLVTLYPEINSNAIKGKFYDTYYNGWENNYVRENTNKKSSPYVHPRYSWAKG